MKRFVSTMFFVASLSLMSLGAAQDPVTSDDGVSTVRPDTWEDVTGNDRATFTFRQPDTKSQIEVVSTALLTADVQDTFFSTFHDGLEEAGFSKIDQNDETLGAHQGVLTTYSFEHSGAELLVNVFQFMLGNDAWLVVSYAGKESAESVSTAFNEIVENLKVKSND